MTDTRWKATERRIAAILGGRRVPVSGRGRGDQPDIAHPWLALEVKDRATLPAWLQDALDQAEASARPDQLPVAVLHRAGDRHDHALVVLRLADFAAWFGARGEVQKCSPPRLPPGRKTLAGSGQPARCWRGRLTRVAHVPRGRRGLVRGRRAGG